MELKKEQHSRDGQKTLPPCLNCFSTSCLPTLFSPLSFSPTCVCVWWGVYACVWMYVDTPACPSKCGCGKERLALDVLLPSAYSLEQGLQLNLELSSFASSASHLALELPLPLYLWWAAMLIWNVYDSEVLVSSPSVCLANTLCT